MRTDPATQPATGRTVPRMRLDPTPSAPLTSPPCTRPPQGWACTLTAVHEGPCPTVPATYRTPPTITAVVVVRVRPRPGQEFGDVHTARATARTWLAALTAAHDAAAGLVRPGSQFYVSSTRRY